MKWALAICLFFAGLVSQAPTAKADCVCPQIQSVARYCIELFCNSRIVIRVCAGGGSCVNCDSAAYEVPCCEFYTVFSAAVSAPCDISTARLIGEPGRAVRAFAPSCDGSIRTGVVALRER